MAKLPDPVTRIEKYLAEIAKGGGGGSSSADDVSYDNTSSGLTATDVQAAIDELAQGSGGTSNDISVSGTFSQNADTPSSSDIGNATFTTSKTLSELIDKVKASGELSIGGCLTQETSLYGHPGYTKYCALKITASAVCDESLTEFLAGQQQISVDENTKMIMCRVSDGAYEVTPPMLVIYLYQGAVQFIVNTEV